MSQRTAPARRRALATTTALALVTTGFVALGSGAATAAPPNADAPQAPAVIGDDEYYMNYVAPRAEGAFDSSDDSVITSGSARGPYGGSPLERANKNDEKFAQGNPVAARQLAKTEAQSIKTGKSPKALKHSKTTQQAKLLTILVEFDGTDDFSDVYVPTEFGATTCMPGSEQGPTLHNNIPNPADAAQPDNNSMWVADFSSEHYNKMLFSEDGITERVRTDLTGPDGKPGFDISGYTMKNMYEEMSRGAYTLTGEATAWVSVPHSEGYYGATVCHLNEEGVYEAGPMQDQQGHPDNPLGPGQLPIDAVAAVAAQNPDFPWADYDIEDQGDRDGDGNVTNPTASSTMSCWCTLARTSRAAAASRAPTRSGRTPRPWPAVPSSPAPTSRSRTTSSSPRTPASACSLTNTATTWVCPTCTTRRTTATPTSTSGT